MTQQKFIVTVGDNFHCGDDDEGSDTAGAFDSLEAAIASAKAIVDESLLWELGQSKPGASGADLFDRWLDFGSSPAVSASAGGPNVWISSDYARAKAAEMMDNDMKRPLSTEALLFSALAFAAHKHRDQRRKGAEASPYINHPIAVGRVLTVEGGVTDPIILAAAILHDTIEDTQTIAEEIRQAFGEDIAAVVLEVTDDKTLPKADRKRLQIEHAPHLSERAQLVKLADKICNVRDVASNPPATWPLSRRQEYFEWARRVVDGLRGSHPVLERTFDEAYQDLPTDA